MARQRAAAAAERELPPKRMGRHDVTTTEASGAPGWVNRYGLDELPEWRRAVWVTPGVLQVEPTRESSFSLWSGRDEPPAIGAEVFVEMNGIGPARVLSYFSEYGWLGLEVLPHNPPAWYVKQNGPDRSGCVFGVDLRGGRE